MANSKSFLSVPFKAVRKLPYIIGKTISADISIERFFEDTQNRVKIMKDATGMDFIIFIKVPKKISQNLQAYDSAAVIIPPIKPIKKPRRIPLKEVRSVK